MPITKDLELPIEYVHISGPAVDALNSRKESDDGPSEDEVTKEAWKNKDSALDAIKTVVERLSVDDR
jgi:hypothetical protein